MLTVRLARFVGSVRGPAPGRAKRRDLGLCGVLTGQFVGGEGEGIFRWASRRSIFGSTACRLVVIVSSM
jgi:hypothetical protein